MDRVMLFEVAKSIEWGIVRLYITRSESRVAPRAGDAKEVV